MKARLNMCEYTIMLPPYQIQPYSFKRAKTLGVTIQPSLNKTKKIDVFRGTKKVASVGARGMSDFPTYQKTHGMTFAKTRRRLYKIRHTKDRKTVGTPGYYADQLLW
jgi:hypothetical protein